MRERRRQNLWIAGAAGVAFVTGVAAVLFLPRVLPDPVDLSVAATVLNADRWRAGGRQDIVDASRLLQANGEALSGCREAAAKAGREQRCTIVVAVPAP